MSVDCGACFAKYLLCFFNFFFFIAGTVVLGVGIWIAADKSSFIQVTKIIQNSDVGDQLSQFTQPTVIEQVAYFLIAAGAFVFIVSFLGYCGALRESRCLLASYGVVLILIITLQLTAIVLAAGYKERAELETRNFFKGTIRNYYSSPEKANGVTVLWDHLMTQLSCCGVDNYTDFRESPAWTEAGLKIPRACCALKDDRTLVDAGCPYREPTDANSYHNTGCYDAFIKLVLAHAEIVIAVCVTLGLIQIIAMFLAFCLCKSIDQYLK